MQVNSFMFWAFFLAVLLPYFTFLRKSVKAQNTWLLAASYFFFGYTEIKMLPIIIIATVIFYFLGIQIEKDNKFNIKRASLLTVLGVIFGVGILIYFKYLNFLVEEFGRLLNGIGLQVNVASLNIVMLLGVSYFTFKLMGYLIAVHRGDMQACKDPIAFGVFVAFFPTLMAGPIDRAQQFIPQLENSRQFTYENTTEGLRRIIWGMFMKMCIADRVCFYVDAVFDNYQHQSAVSVLIASFFYFIQAYTDFCGYSNMAIGVGQIMGLKVRENFNRPYMAQNLAELWRRFHMSLTTWITDYIFMPLNVRFRNMGVWGLYLATLINMIVVGAWHGANWTYVVFGIYHGVLISIISAVEKPRKRFEKKYNLRDRWYYVWPRRIFTWILFGFGTALFRADSIHTFGDMLMQFGEGLGSISDYDSIYPAFYAIPCLAVLFFKEWKDESNINVHFLHSENRLVYWATTILLLLIIYYGGISSSSFIYYQF